ncbi:metal-sensitive transcriptional regulator [Alkalicoccus urumqiensis]|uniref:Transcriptional regulator n=1 Tax=Alkalicoccus urumqiensis TaxID=1548213 RepID=A0A2P6MDW2_ALKUR|nr:metal-sensing transcriptional repressor [Alkalicoccus urumqiensis]PRO64460.1 transcriptional regulator [Alkalicoccus urumqiensis]
MEHKVHSRTPEEKKQLQQRLRRVEGQVRGLQQMIEEDRYCIDILIQLSAVQNALKKTGYEILEDHTKGCVTNAVENGDGDAVMDELMQVIRQFSK